MLPANVHSLLNCCILSLWAKLTADFIACRHPGNLLATPERDLAYLDFGMMSSAPRSARFAIIAHVVHLVNRDYEVCPGYCVESSCMCGWWVTWCWQRLRRACSRAPRDTPLMACCAASSTWQLVMRPGLFHLLLRL